jgi:hypothetical protein
MAKFMRNLGDLGIMSAALAGCAPFILRLPLVSFSLRLPVRDLLAMSRHVLLG